jgi:hypothetical protein
MPEKTKEIANIPDELNLLEGQIISTQFKATSQEIGKAVSSCSGACSNINQKVSDKHSVEFLL